MKAINTEEIQGHTFDKPVIKGTSVMMSTGGIAYLQNKKQ